MQHAWCARQLSWHNRGARVLSWRNHAQVRLLDAGVPRARAAEALAEAGLAGVAGAIFHAPGPAPTNRDSPHTPHPAGGGATLCIPLVIRHASTEQTGRGMALTPAPAPRRATTPTPRSAGWTRRRHAGCAPLYSFDYIRIIRTGCSVLGPHPDLVARGPLGPWASARRARR
jgi:hypothetical protein